MTQASFLQSQVIELGKENESKRKLKITLEQNLKK